MKNRLMSVSAVFVLAAGVTGAVYQDRSAEQRGAAELKAGGTSWPLDRAGCWAVRLPEGTTKLSMEVRTKSIPRLPNQGLALELIDRAMARGDSTEVWGPSTISFEGVKGEVPSEAEAVVQFLDLKRVGVELPAGTSTLRLLCSLRWGGASVRPFGERALLPAGQFTGHQIQRDPKWIDDELVLMTVWVETTEAWVRRDVLLVRNGGGPSSRATTGRAATAPAGEQ